MSEAELYRKAVLKPNKRCPKLAASDNYCMLIGAIVHTDVEGAIVCKDDFESCVFYKAFLSGWKERELKP